MMRTRAGSEANSHKLPPLSRLALGVVVNPVAGIGGRVGLKGSDGAEIQKKAFALGALPEALDRTVQALERVKPLKEDLQVITYPAEMGEDAARACGLEPTVIGSINQGETTPQDTENAAIDMLRLRVNLLLFAGGDGTARDVCNAIGETLPVLGIPAGVKIHSAVFATNPINAGELAALYLQGKVASLRAAEVMDVDEEGFRRGIVSAKLYGYLSIPSQTRLVQSVKAPSSPGEEASMEAIAYDIIDRMDDDCFYIIGPGTTTRAITSRLGLSKTLIGVDVVAARKLVAVDVNESQLLELLEGRKAKIIVTPIGGQGCIFGRGNQQISPKVIEKVGKDNIIVVGTTRKVNSLAGRPLWVDTGERAVDRMLSGYVKIVTGYNEQMIYKVSC